MYRSDERLWFERSLHLARISVVLWITIALWAGTLFQVMLGLRVMPPLHTLLWIEVFVEVPLKALLVFLLERNGGVNVAVTLVVECGILCGIHLIQFIYHATLFGRCRDAAAQLTAKCLFPMPELRVISFLTILTYMVLNVILLVFASLMLRFMRRHAVSRELSTKVTVRNADTNTVLMESGTVVPSEVSRRANGSSVVTVMSGATLSKASNPPVTSSMGSLMLAMRSTNQKVQP